MRRYRYNNMKLLNTRRKNIILIHYFENKLYIENSISARKE